MAMDVRLYSTLDDVAQCLRQFAHTDTIVYLRFEMLQKKSFFMLDPALKQLFYIDRLGHPLLKMQSDALLAVLPNATQLIDISRLTAEHNLHSQTGYHANQPVHEGAAWQQFALQQIQQYHQQQRLLRTPAAVKPGSVSNNERMNPLFSVAAKVNSLFGRKRALPSEAKTTATVSPQTPQKK